MSGTDKRKLLVVGKEIRPRCFKGLRLESLPVTYHANNNAWMTADIFKQWLMDWDLQLQQLDASRKILLLVNKCASHPNMNELKSIQLEFLPHKMSGLFSPMNMGIIQNLKLLYRQTLLNHILE
ncbi:hypothetical protein HELRODRAFT_92082, partial [Helobdella robusta]|uniref:DDE-1 domain-containing protein n=1 Tax=Helobdella robusta TaxID=6412 RepID=T1G8C0_HELRO